VLAVNLAEGPEAGTSDAQVKLVKVQTWDVAGEYIALSGSCMKTVSKGSDRWGKRGGTIGEGRPRAVELDVLPRPHLLLASFSMPYTSNYSHM